MNIHSNFLHILTCFKRLFQKIKNTISLQRDRIHQLGCLCSSDEQTYIASSKHEIWHPTNCTAAKEEVIQ